MDANSLFTRNKIYKEKDSTGTSQMNTKPKYHLAFKSMEPDGNDYTDFFYQECDHVFKLNESEDSA